MKADSPSIPLIRTKLHRPSTATVQVHRDHLLDRLNAGLNQYLTVVAAPAGYGKSTLVSQWLEGCGLSTAWLSVDDTDNDFHLFLSYFVAAVQTAFPQYGEETQIILKVSQLPPLPVLAAHMINELDEIDEAFILVIDDYHVIRNSLIHQLFEEILKHPPRAMHLVLVSRFDPPLSLSKLRAKRQMTEIRTADLRFSRTEVADFLYLMLGEKVKEGTAVLYEQKTEGWITGLHLAALSLRNREDLESVVADLPANNRFVMEYLVDEILSQQTPEIQDCLLKSSILDRFCAPLCVSVCSSNVVPGDIDTSGQDFLQRLKQGNLFVIPLDDEHRWFRYHHLFQNLLKRSLEKRFNAEDISLFHANASRWFSGNGFIDEALQHAITSGDMEAAASLVSRHRHDIMNSEQWHQLERWLSMLPADVIENKPELVILKAWLCEYRMRLEEIGTYLQQVAHHFISEPTVESVEWNSLRAEFYTLSAFDSYLKGDNKSTIDFAEKALRDLAPNAQHSRVNALFLLSIGYQISGDLARAYNVVYKVQQEHRLTGTTPPPRLYLILVFVHWLAVDLTGLRQVCSQLLKICEDSNLPESQSVAQHFLGTLHYLRNNLEEADKYLGVVQKDYYKSTMLNAAHNAFALALSLEGQGRSEEAHDVVESTINKSMNSGSRGFQHLAQGLQAELFLRQGRIAQAQIWATNFEVHPFDTGYRFYVPQFTYVKVLLARNTPEDLKRAEDLLCELHAYYGALHNTKCLIDVLVLQSLLYAELGQDSKAYEKLGEALALSEAGELIRPFLDLGDQMSDLLKRYAEQETDLRFVRQIMQAFGNADIGTGADVSEQPSSSSEQVMPEPLTGREIEILAVLSKGLSNQAIADSLFISRETVKRHLYNIFQKLDAKNRQQAIVRAKSLGIV